MPYYIEYKIFRIRLRVTGFLVYLWFILIHPGDIIFSGKWMAWHHLAMMKSDLYMFKKTSERVNKLRAEILAEAAKEEG